MIILPKYKRDKNDKKFFGAEKFAAAADYELDLFLFLVKNIYLIVQHVLVL